MYLLGDSPTAGQGSALELISSQSKELAVSSSVGAMGKEAVEELIALFREGVFAGVQNYQLNCRLENRLALPLEFPENRELREYLLAEATYRGAREHRPWGYRSFGTPLLDGLAVNLLRWSYGWTNSLSAVELSSRSFFQAWRLTKRPRKDAMELEEFLGTVLTRENWSPNERGIARRWFFLRLHRMPLLLELEAGPELDGDRQEIPGTLRLQDVRGWTPGLRPRAPEEWILDGFKRILEDQRERQVLARRYLTAGGELIQQAFKANSQLQVLDPALLNHSPECPTERDWDRRLELELWDAGIAPALQGCRNCKEILELSQDYGWG